MAVRATLAGAMAIVTGLLPVDVTKRSTSFEARLYKYSAQKCYKVLNRLTSETFSNNQLRSKTDDSSSNSDYSGTNNYHHDGVDELCSDTDYLNNYWLRKDRPDKVVFVGKTFSDVWLMTENCMTETFIGTNWYDKRGWIKYPRRSQLTAEKIRSMFPDEAERQRFIHLIYVEGDEDRATDMAQQRQHAFVQEVLPRFDLMRGKVLWHDINPGTQASGSFNPAIMDPKEWFGDDYEPLRVGLPDEIYLEVRRLFHFIPILRKNSRDVMYLIIRMVFKNYIMDQINELLC